MAEIDYQYYSGQDLYSDGEIENALLRYVEEEDYDSAILNDADLAVFYHLSDVRTALLNWYDFLPNSSALEIGGGMGALTGLLCDRCGSVVTVEMSRKRASAIAMRCKDKENLRIMVGDFDEMEFSEKFDYITLIGVLEHQSAFRTGENVFRPFLEKVRSLLAPGGKLLLAIENRFGLKYWCGEVDDHTGIPFGTIRQKNYDNLPRTFDRDTLKKLLNSAGFSKMRFYYPLPDYKFPRVVYSDDYLPDTDLNTAVFPLHYSNFYPYQPVVAREEELYHSIIGNGVFPFFANSFFVETGMEECDLSRVTFASVTVEREKKYRQIIRLNDGKFEKYSATPDGTAHIFRGMENLRELAQRGLPVIPAALSGNRIIMPRIKAQTREDIFLSLVKNGESERALLLLDQHFSMIMQSSEHLPENAFHVPKELAEKAEGVRFGTVLRYAYCDMLLSNCFVTENGDLLYDQEWRFDNLPASFVMFCALKVLYDSHSWIEKSLPGEKIFSHFQITPEIRDVYGCLLESLYRDVQNSATCNRIGVLRENKEETIESNIDLLMNGIKRIKDLCGETAQLTCIVEEQSRQIAGRDEVIREKDGQIAGREEVIREKDGQIAGREEVIREKDGQIAGRDEVIREKDGQIAGRDEVIREKDDQIAGREEVIREKDSQIAEKERIITDKESIIRRQTAEIEENRSRLLALENEVNSFYGESLSERARIAFRCLKKGERDIYPKEKTD